METLTFRVPPPVARLFRKAAVRYGFVLLVGALLAALFSACSSGSQPAVLLSDTALMNRQLAQYRLAEPTHFYEWSADVAALNAIQDARAAGKSTYTLFMNRGFPDPYFECPSRGYPVPGDTQLTNPDQVVNGTYSGSSGYWGVTIPQIDPAGGYTSHATASTYTLCVAPDGRTYAKYDESDVNVFPFPVTWDYNKHHVVVDPAVVASFDIPFDQAKADVPPRIVTIGADGSTTLRSPNGTVTTVQGAGTPQPTRTP